MEASAATPRVIEPDSGRRFPSLSEIWRHKDLAYYLARRGVLARYKQSVVGVFWAILQPLLLAIVFSVFLGLLAKVPSQPGVPYPVFAVSGMVLWMFIQGALQSTSQSTVANEILISKIYFPRILLPLTSMCPPALDFAFGFLVVIGAMLLYGVSALCRDRLRGGALALGPERQVSRHPAGRAIPDPGGLVHQPDHLPVQSRAGEPPAGVRDQPGSRPG
jgi:ABC-2 type transporter